jgi:enediyne biosynthesis protein E4
LVYRNLGNGRFEDVSAQAGAGIAQQKSSRGAAFGDFDNDGDVDVLVMNMGDTPSLLRNDLSSSNHWIQLRLEGSKSNRSAIGATVRIETAGAFQTQSVLSQSSYVSQNDFRLHFGLGSAARADRISVRWPSGTTEQFPGAAADGQFLLVEGSGTSKRMAGNGTENALLKIPLTKGGKKAKP